MNDHLCAQPGSGSGRDGGRGASPGRGQGAAPPTAQPLTRAAGRSRRPGKSDRGRCRRWEPGAVFRIQFSGFTCMSSLNAQLNPDVPPAPFCTRRHREGLSLPDTRQAGPSGLCPRQAAPQSHAVNCSPTGPGVRGGERGPGRDRGGPEGWGRLPGAGLSNRPDLRCGASMK